MKLFGLQIPWTERQVAAAQELPTSGRRQTSSNDRTVPGDSLSDFWLQLPDKLEPKRVSSILRGALAGNLWQQTQLTSLILDSWPMARHCSMELRGAVAGAKYVVHPYALPDKDPTPRAKEKADLVRRNLENFKPDRFSDESGRSGIIYDLTHDILDGVSIVELLWDRKAQGPDGEREHRVRAGAWVHPKHYGFSGNGRVGVAKAEPQDALQFPLQGGAGTKPKDLMDDPSLFLVSRFKSKSGSVLGYGLMRVLAYYWCTIVYGRDFMLAFAQKYGNPFLDIAYEAGLKDHEIAEFERLAKRAAANGWMVHDVRGTVGVTAPQSMGGDNANVQLMRIANEACQILFLGQTLTTSAPVNGGTRAQGEVHETVLDKKKEQHCARIAEVLTEQFAETLLLENYAESSERPTVQVDLTRPLTIAEKGTFLQAASTSTIALPVEPVYKILDLPVPQPGDKVLVHGDQVIMEEAVTPTERRQQQMDEQMDAEVQFSKLQQPQGNPKNKAKASEPARRLFLRASNEELQGFHVTLKQAVKAKAEGRLNGELGQVKTSLAQLEGKHRI